MDRGIPKEWSLEKLGNISFIQYGKGLPKSNLLENGYPVFGANGIIGYYDKFLFKEEQLLISCRGAYSGKINFSPREAFITNNSLIVDFFAEKFILRRFYFYMLQIADKSTLVTGSAQPQVTINNAIELTVILPPLAEQKEIVSRIEELFSELDNGIENLKKAKEQIKTYRQSLLKNAFEGKLTEKWRKENPDKIEAPEILLEKIKKAREEHYLKQIEEWEQQVKEWEENGKKGKKPSKPKKYTVVETDMTKKEDKLFYKTVKIGEVFDVFVGATPSRKVEEYWNGKINWVSSGEVSFCKIHKTKETITELGLNNSSTEIHPTNTIMLGMIGEGKTRGQVAILKTEAAHNQNTAAIRTHLSKCSPELLYYYFYYQYENTRRIGSGNNQKALNKSRVENIIYPLFSISEQNQIVQIIEEKFSVCDKLEETINESLEKSEFLRQSILKKAFSGDLTKEWRKRNSDLITGENSAENLLKRIKAEKEAKK